MNFDSAVFSDYANFKSGKYRNIADFRDARFAGIVEFGQTQFGHGVIFNETQFEEECDFSKVKFGEQSIFSRLNFETNVSFEKSYFIGNLVDIEYCHFKGCSNFNGVEFNNSGNKGTAEFKGCIFDGKSDFQRVNFLIATKFTSLIFNDDISFSLANFQNSAMSNSKQKQYLIKRLLQEKLVFEIFHSETKSRLKTCRLEV